MDIRQLVGKWMKVVPQLALAHDADERDRAESQINDLLLPLLTAPVAELRDFYALLVTTLKSNKSIPYWIWRTFEFWHETSIAKADDQGIIRLQKQLAIDIVDLAHQHVVADLREAMFRSLMLRDPQQLQDLKQDVDEATAAGKKIRVRGKESCLFVEIPSGSKAKRRGAKKSGTDIML